MIIVGLACFSIGVLIGGVIFPWGETLDILDTILSSDHLIKTILAICAISLTIWQGASNRKHNRLSTRPHLTLTSNTLVKDVFYSADLKNDGLGPAFIKDISIFLDDKEVSRHDLPS